MATSDGFCGACFKTLTGRNAAASEKPVEKKLVATSRQLSVSSTHSKDGENTSGRDLRKKLSWPDDASLTKEREIDTITEIDRVVDEDNKRNEIRESNDENEEINNVTLELDRIRSLKTSSNVTGSEWDLSDFPPLILAARERNIWRTKELLRDDDVDISATARGGITALHVAAIEGHDEIVRELLQLQKCGGLQVDRRSTDQTLKLLKVRTDPEQLTALHMAACSSNEQIVKDFWSFLNFALVSEGTLEEILNARDCVGRTPLYYAVLNDNLDVAAELLSWKFVDVNASDKDGFTALHLSAWRGNEKLVSKMLEHDGEEGIGDINANPRANDTEGTINYLSGLEKTDGSSNFLPRPKLTAFTIKEEHNGVTPLHYAVKKSNADIVTTLLKNPSVDIHMENDEHQTIFDMALTGQNDRILWELLDSLREPYDVWEKVRHHLSMMRYVGNFKANDRTEDKMLNNCGVLLMRAVDTKNFEHITYLIRMLQAKLSNMNQQLIADHSKSNVTLLHHAALAGLAKLVEVLSQIPIADINTLDNELQTPLHYAAVMGHANVVYVLINNTRCNLNAEDKYSRSAIQLAVESGQMDVEKLLMDRSEVRDYVDRFYKNREVFVDAANTMLLAAALIAGVTFAGFLQPPGGFTPYADLETGAPGDPQSYAAVNQHVSTRVFWVFNSMSFFCSIGTIIAGAGAVLPTLDAFIATEVKFVKRTLVATSTLLVFAVVFIVAAFASAGYASLPPLAKYEKPMTFTVVFGGIICVITMLWFLKRLYGIRPSWVRFLQEKLRDKFWPGRHHHRRKHVFRNPTRPSFHSSFPR